MTLPLHINAAPQRLSIVAALLLASCATASRDRAWVSTQLEERVGYGLRTSGSDSASGVDLTDGIDEDEAAALALFSSPAFLMDMARLRTAEANFEEARRPDNPRLSALAPIGAISAAVSLVAPIMSFFQIPRRSAAANRALEAVAESLVQSGLDTARDARIAHIDCVVAARRVVILQEQQGTAEELAHLSEIRAALGDVSPADALLVRSQAALAADAVALAERDQQIAVATFFAMLGIDATGGTPAPHLTASRDIPLSAPPLADLIAVARQARPDVRAAEMELESAGAQIGVERARILSVSLQADVQWASSGVGVRLGGSLELPIFDQNQGGRGRAEAAFEAAVQRVLVVRHRVTLEVVTAKAQLQQALTSYARFRRDVLPPLELALAATTQQYELGEAAYLVVLDAAARLGDASLRVVELEADSRRAHAQLERGIGARIELSNTEDSP